MGFGVNSDNTLRWVSIQGGPSSTIVDLGGVLRGASWGPDGTIVYATGGGGLMQVSEAGGEPRPLTEPEGSMTHWWPEFLPNGRGVLFTARQGSGETSEIRVLDFASGVESEVAPVGSNPRYANSGHVVYVIGNDLWAVGFDAESLEVTSDPMPAQQSVAAKRTGAANFDISEDGILVFTADDTPAVSRILGLAHRNGDVEPLSVPPAQYFSPRISPDGSRLAVQTQEDDGTNQIWVYDLAGDTQIQRLTQDGSNQRPVWTPDNERVTFSSDIGGTLGIYSQPADLSGAAEKLLTVEDVSGVWPSSWSPNGQTLAFTSSGQVRGRSIWTVSSETGSTPELFYDVPGSIQSDPVFSPDGEWLAYSSQESGANQIYVKSLSQAGLPRIQVTRVASAFPMWSRDGTEMFYRRALTFGGNTGATLFSVDIATDRGFTFTNEQALPAEGVFGTFRGYDIMPDGERFVVVIPADQTETTESAPPQVNVVLNWFEELKQLVPVP